MFQKLINIMNMEQYDDQIHLRSSMNKFKLNNTLLFFASEYFSINGLEKKLVTSDLIVIDSTKIKVYANIFRTKNINGLVSINL